MTETVVKQVRSLNSWFEITEVRETSKNMNNSISYSALLNVEKFHVAAEKGNVEAFHVAAVKGNVEKFHVAADNNALIWLGPDHSSFRV